MLWPWAHTGSICGQAWSVVFIPNMMDCQVCVREKLLLPDEEYGPVLSREKWRQRKTKLGVTDPEASSGAWVQRQSSQFTGQATSQRTPLTVSTVITRETLWGFLYVNEISLLYTVVGVCAPLEGMKECPGNAFWKKAAVTLLSQTQRLRPRETDLAKRLQLVYSWCGNSAYHRNHSKLYNCS